ncbi:hypothetical protein [Nonomuraea diastatica]|uniref:hypothetical protein n=1 Tax=Nonomuraea diastatica TaxID=1848329 RepID=UPI001C7085CF|nr:hypothetical protein [Nonomuraea diastatica]
MEIWINPGCSKCRSALSILDAEAAAYTVRRYLDDPPTESDIREVLARLGLEPWDITRTGEPVAARLGMASWPREPGDRDRWIGALAANPVLIQRRCAGFLPVDEAGLHPSADPAQTWVTRRVTPTSPRSPRRRDRRRCRSWRQVRLGLEPARVVLDDADVLQGRLAVESGQHRLEPLAAAAVARDGHLLWVAVEAAGGSAPGGL